MTYKIETETGTMELSLNELKALLLAEKALQATAKKAAKDEKIAFRNKLKAAKEIVTPAKVKELKQDAKVEHFGFMACLKTALFVCGKDGELTAQFGVERFTTSSQVCKDWSLLFKNMPAKKQPQPTKNGLYNVGKMVDAVKNYLIAEYTGTIGN